MIAMVFFWLRFTIDQFKLIQVLHSIKKVFQQAGRINKIKQLEFVKLNNLYKLPLGYNDHGDNEFKAVKTKFLELQ